VSPEDIDFLEAHGTGTSLGDPIEIGAVGALIKDRPKDDPLLIGSVKTNVGHLEAAAGMAGLIKAVLSLENESIPAHLHFKTPNPHIPWDDLPIEVPTEAVPWPKGDERRVAAVSAFGLAGTNSHVVVAEAPDSTAAPAGDRRPMEVVTLTAKTDSALKAAAAELGEHLASHPDESLAEVCFTMNRGRAHFRRRLAFPASDLAEASERLVSFSQGSAGRIATGAPAHGARPKVAMLFSGQGSQYAGMGNDLYDSEPAFREALDACAAALEPYLERPLLSVLFEETGDDSPLHSTAYTQPALFAIEYALAQTWRSWGIKPAVVLGHSVGEYAAACIAGVFSLEDGLKLIAERGRLMQALPLDGGMAAVFASEARVAEAIAGHSDSLSIAAVNGPESIVISGRKTDLDEVVAKLSSEEITAKLLQVSHAFHSPLMEPMLDEFEKIAGTVNYSAPRIPVVSNLTGEVVDSAGVFSPEYWRKHVRQAVRFADSIGTLIERDQQIFLEVGPGNTLIGMGMRCDADGERAWLSSLKRPAKSGTSSDFRQILDGLSELYVRGCPIDWQRFHSNGGQRVTLPTYPFERRRYWVEDEREALQEQSSGTLLQKDGLEELAERLESSGRFTADELALIPKLLEAAAEESERNAAASSVDDWLYEVDWGPAEAESVGADPDRTAPSRWLVFADQDGRGDALAKALNDAGQDAVRIYPGEGFERRDDGAFVIHPERDEDYAQLLAETFHAQIEQPWGLVHLWSLDVAGRSGDANEQTLEELVADHRFVCDSVIRLGRSLVGHGANVPPRLWMVTGGSQSVTADDEVIDLAGAPLWGFGRVLASENPPYWGGLIDIERTTSADMAGDQIAAALQDPSREDQVAFRNGERYVARLTRSLESGTREFSIDPERSYLVTGGFGGLGLNVARWLAQHGAKQLVLVGRSGATSDVARAAVAELADAGVRIHEGKADLASKESTANLLTEIGSSMAPLAGIVHCAGVLDDGILTQQTWERFEKVMQPKVAGAWNLHQLTADAELDFFVLFSSASSLFGAPGQGNYAAANAFLDSFAFFRERKGMNTVAVNWGPWAESGMAMDQQVAARLQARGTTAFRETEGMIALEKILGSTQAQVAAIRIDWDTVAERQERGLEPPSPPLLSRFVEREDSSDADAPTAVAIRKALEEADADARPALLVEYVTQHSSDVLGRGRSEEIPGDEPLLHLGLDSLMAVQLRNALSKDLDVSVPVATFLEGASIESLVEHVLTELAPSLDGASDGSSAKESDVDSEAAEELLGKVDDLSADEVDALLGSMLDQGDA